MKTPIAQNMFVVLATGVYVAKLYFATNTIDKYADVSTWEQFSALMYYLRGLTAGLT